MNDIKIQWLLENFIDCLYYGYYYNSCKQFSWFISASSTYGIDTVKYNYNQALKEISK